jgi:hypothetical protein
MRESIKNETLHHATSHLSPGIVYFVGAALWSAEAAWSCWVIMDGEEEEGAGSVWRKGS